MSIELNIGLHAAGQDNSAAASDRRAADALARLGDLVDYSERYETRYEGPSGTVVEPGLFVRLNINILLVCVGTLYAVAEIADQDCISAYDPATRHGLLIGPQSQNWGSFNASFFVRARSTAWTHWLEAA